MGFLKNLFSGSKSKKKPVQKEEKVEEEVFQKDYDYFRTLFETGSDVIVIDSDIKLGKSNYEIFKENLERPENDQIPREGPKQDRIVLDRDNIVVDGQGHVIDALGKMGVFIVRAQNVVLKNINFEGIYNKDEPAVHIIGGASCEIINCRFKAEKFPGVVIDEASSCTISGDDSINVGSISVKEGCSCKISDVAFNKVANHGEVELFSTVIRNNSHPGIYNYAHMKMQSCEISDCKCKNHPPVDNRGNLEIYDSTFKNNINGDEGGVIQNSADLKVFNSTFTANDSNGGGAIAGAGEVLIDGCTFELNRSSPHGLGGALSLNGKSTISNTTFRNNSSNYNGGAVSNEGDMTITDSKFIDNSAAFDAGAVLNLKKLEMYSSCFKYNRSSKGGALINQGNLNVFDCKFLENKATKIAGALLCDGSKLIRIHDSVFEGNFAKNGCAIVNQMGDLALFDCKIRNHNTLSIDEGDLDDDEYSNWNALKDAMDKIVSQDRSVLDFDIENMTARDVISDREVDFIENNAENYVYVKNDDGIKIDEMAEPGFGSIIINEDILNMSNSIVSDNYSSALILNTKKGVLNLETGEFKNNNSFEAGIFNAGVSFSMSNTGFEQNTSNRQGVSDILNATSMTISNPEGDSVNSINMGVVLVKKDENDFLTCINNQSEIRFMISVDEDPSVSNGFSMLDELIHAKTDDNTVLLDCDFRLFGHELDFYEGGIDIDIDNLTIDGQGNTISGSKLSRIFLISANNVTLKNIVFRDGFLHRVYDNIEKGGGVILSNSYTDVRIENCKFIENESQLWAGAIQNSGSMELFEDEFTGNFAHNDGAIRNERGFLKIERCKFEKNSSKNYGGVLSNKDRLEIYDCEFNNNSAKYFGGAILNEKNLLVKSSKFTSNFQSDKFMGQSVAGGGAIITTGGDENNVTIDGCEFISNSTYSYGGAIHIKSGTEISIKDSYFFDNVAEWGGAVFLSGSGLEAYRLQFKENGASQGGAVFAMDNYVVRPDGTAKVIDVEELFSDCTFEGNSPNDFKSR